MIAERFLKRYGERLGERLVIDGILDEAAVERAVSRQQATGERLGEALVALGLISAQHLGPYLEKTTGFPFLDLSELDLDPAATALLAEPFAVARRVLAVKFEGEAVLLAMADPLDIATLDEVKARLGRPVKPCLILTPDLREATRRAYDARAKARTVLDEIATVGFLDQDEEADQEQDSDAPIVRLLNNVLAGAFAAGASDVHLEPRAGSVMVRYRVDGLLYDQLDFPMGHLAPTISRLKIMAGLDISENRRPQDGRFSARDDQGNEYDARLSIIPTVHGQKACLRLLEKSNAVPSLEQLGFLPEQRETFEKFLREPHGLILVTGPTGSGKSTTLYSSLHFIGDPTRNINTIEDPVEYELPFANQIQVNPKIGLSFAAGLRALLRQDPDVILVGEIRDRETAEIAIQAAMTGHLVLSTLHTNDAPSALVRLQNMGIEPFLITSAVIGVVGQRLLRKVCPYCKETYVPTPESMHAFGLGARPQTLARGRGCRRCGDRGMRGRTAAYEVMTMSETLREMVLSGASGPSLTCQARSEGLQTMRQAACRKVIDQLTTPEEMLRVFSQGE